MNEQNDNNDKIICPNCKKEIPISKSVASDVFKSFEFLNDSKENIYTLGDGEPI